MASLNEVGTSDDSDAAPVKRATEGHRQRILSPTGTTQSTSARDLNPTHTPGGESSAWFGWLKESLGSSDSAVGKLRWRPWLLKAAFVTLIRLELGIIVAIDLIVTAGRENNKQQAIN